MSAALIFASLLDFSLKCLMELPTGEFFVPDGGAADDAAYAYGGGESGESYTVDFSTPYTSFLFTILSGAASIFVAA